MDVWCFPERKTEMRMSRWMCGVSLKERQHSTELRRRLGLDAIGDVTKRGRLWSHGHIMERKSDAPCVKACAWLLLEGIVLPTWRKTWQTTVTADMRRLKVTPGTYKQAQTH